MELKDIDIENHETLKFSKLEILFKIKKNLYWTIGIPSLEKVESNCCLMLVCDHFTTQYLEITFEYI